MGIMFWLWSGIWVAGWAVIIGLHFWYKGSTAKHTAP